MIAYERMADCTSLAVEIARLAEIAQQGLPAGSVPWREAVHRAKHPIDYMRYAEFPAILEYIDLKDEQSILDVSSPQWLSLYLAYQNPKVTFTYVNISQMELAAVRDTAVVLGLENIQYECQDVRKLQFADRSFDGCLSVSVLEHIEPEVGGEILALQEISRVLKPGGNLWLTIPFKDRQRVLESSSPGYEGQPSNDRGQYFFAREYSEQQWSQILNQTGLIPQRQTYIIEKPGLLALDYWAYGPRRSSVYGKTITLSMRLLARFQIKGLPMILARRQLKLSDQPGHRLANLAGHYCVPK